MTSQYRDVGGRYIRYRRTRLLLKKLSIDVESLHSPTFYPKCCTCKMEKSDGHGKLGNGHGQYFVKSVGTLLLYIIFFIM